MTLAEALARAPTIDGARLDATSEADVRRHMEEDGFDPDEEVAPERLREVLPPAQVRRRLGLTQEQFARALRIPLATLRNWEQGRVVPDPAARSLLRIVAHAPEVALAALRG